MFFYSIANKLGSVFQGWVNGNYDKKTTVIPRVYHKYLKDDDHANLYPIGTLTVTSKAGTTTDGDTTIAIKENKLNAVNTYKYAFDVRMPRKNDNLKSWTAWDGTSDIAAGEAKTICIAEVDGNNIVAAAGLADVVAKVTVASSASRKGATKAAKKPEEVAAE